MRYRNVDLPRPAARGEELWLHMVDVEGRLLRLRTEAALNALRERRNQDAVAELLPARFGIVNGN